MKRAFVKIINMASVAAIGVVIYLLISKGLFEAIGREVQRYSDLNINYLYIFAIFVIGSYLIGYIFSKLKVQ